LEVHLTPEIFSLEIDSPIAEGAVKMKTGGAFST